MNEYKSNKKKITIITSPSGWGGTERHTVELTRMLGTQGHQISLVEVGSNLYERVKFSNSGNIRVCCLADSKPILHPGLRESIHILREVSGDVLIHPKGNIFEGSWHFDFIARMKFARYITIEHSAAEPLPPKSSRKHFNGLIPGIGLWWYKQILCHFYRSIFPSSIICVSNAVSKILIDQYRFSPQKVTIVQNGIDTNQFQPNSDCREAFRKNWGIHDDALVFGSIGRLHQIKGFRLAIELFGKLVAQDPSRNVWFVLIGDGPEREALRQLAEDPLIKNNTILINFTDRPWVIYPAIDVFLMPSLNEGLPLTLLEAMSCGCCPIAMAVGGVSEVIIDKSLGWLVQPNDKNNYFQAMKEVSEIAPNILREIGRKARERIVLNFEANRQFMKLAEFIGRD